MGSMNTETQPDTIRAGALGSGGKYHALAVDHEELSLVDECFDYWPGHCLYMPAMTLSLLGKDGLSYAGPSFSLS